MIISVHPAGIVPVGFFSVRGLLVESFIEELVRYARSGQAAFYVNSREESRVVDAVRVAGWRMTDKKINNLDDVEVFRGTIVTAMLRGGIDTKICDQVEKTGNFQTSYLIDALAGLNRLISRDDGDGKELELLQKELLNVLNQFGATTITWDMVDGFSDTKLTADSLRNALFRVRGREVSDQMKHKCFIVFKDCHTHLNHEKPEWRRALRNCCEQNTIANGEMSRHLIFLQPYMRVHEDIRHCLVRLDLPLPGEAEIDNEVTIAQQNISNPDKRGCPPEIRSELISSLKGLDTITIERTLAYCVSSFNGFVPEILAPDGKKKQLIPTIRNMRSKQLSAGQGLRIIDPSDPELSCLGDLGGYENVKELAERIKFCRSARAKALGIVSPSGFAIAGPPGTGKTISAKLFARWIGVPLCVLNLGTLKDSFVGASESNTADAIETIRAMGDVVVLMDEFDKQTGGIIGGASDGNTSSGMLSLILDFASDPSRRAFLVLTMNRVTGPIESLRAGRISRFFYTPIPDAIDREVILRLKLAEQGAVVPANIKDVAADKITADLVGAELAEMVNEAITLSAARSGIKEPTLDDFKEARSVVTPVSKLNKAEVTAMGDLDGVAVSVSNREKRDKVQTVAPSKKMIRLDPNRN